MNDSLSIDEQLHKITVHAGGTFMQFRVDFLRRLEGNCNAAVVLSYLSNQLAMKKSNPDDRRSIRRNGLWFKIPLSTMMKHLGIKEDKLRSAVSTLKESGVIKTKRRGGNKQWVWIDATVLDEWQNNDPFTGNLEPGKSRNRNRENPGTGTGKIPEPEPGKSRNPPTKKPSKENLSNSRPLRADEENGGFSHLLNGRSTNGEQKPPSKAKRYAVQLKDLLDKHRQLMRRPNLGKWTTSMEELLTKRSPREVRVVLDWLEEHLMDTYCPKVRSAESLLLKFSAVEDAMDRHKKREDGVDENKKPREWWIKQNMLPPEERW